VKTEQVDALLLVVEGNDAVGEEEAGVRMLGLVR
jgi:hypothetical protein